MSLSLQGPVRELVGYVPGTTQMKRLLCSSICNQKVRNFNASEWVLLASLLQILALQTRLYQASTILPRTVHNRPDASNACASLQTEVLKRGKSTSFFRKSDECSLSQSHKHVQKYDLYLHACCPLVLDVMIKTKNNVIRRSPSVDSAAKPSAFMRDEYRQP